MRLPAPGRRREFLESADTNTTQRSSPSYSAFRWRSTCSSKARKVPQIRGQVRLIRSSRSYILIMSHYKWVAKTNLFPPSSLGNTQNHDPEALNNRNYLYSELPVNYAPFFLDHPDGQMTMAILSTRIQTTHTSLR